jgi:hypothetical protein
VPLKFRAAGVSGFTQPFFFPLRHQTPRPTAFAAAAKRRQQTGQMLFGAPFDKSTRREVGMGLGQGGFQFTGTPLGQFIITWTLWLWQRVKGFHQATPWTLIFPVTAAEIRAERRSDSRVMARWASVVRVSSFDNSQFK